MVLFMLLELEYCFEKATVPLGKLPCCRRTFRIDSVKHIRVEETCGKWWDLSQSLVLCRRHFLPSARGSAKQSVVTGGRTVGNSLH